MAGYRGYANANDLEQALIAGNYLAGVQFDESAAYPNKLAYALRFPSVLRTQIQTFYSDIFTWSTDKLFPEDDSSGPRDIEDADGGVPVGYLREGFLPIQQAISMAYLKIAGKQSVLPEIVMQRFPYPEHIDKDSVLAVKKLDYAITMIIMLIYMHLTINVSYVSTGIRAPGIFYLFRSLKKP